MATNAITCSECGGGTHEIKIIDKGHFNTSTELQYAVPEAKISFWTGMFPAEGRVAAHLCDTCGRIALYGVPKD